ncbi:hypothetical protein [Candidatus Uabimicrobium sp. HlEnr_7]|uniref:hypothetical protein n=1 Tax=Candidatus Uabimicrobium helgolandensis TaxID=3095367 RepID=UPI0035589E49
MSEICKKFRAQIATILIEPDEETVEFWKPHLQKCVKCRVFLDQSKEEQETGQNLTNNLLSYVPSPPTISKKIPTFYAVAASALLCFIAIYIFTLYKNVKFPQKIEALIYEEIGNVDKLAFVNQKLNQYGESFTVEMKQIAKNIDEAEQLLESKFIPLLRVRLIFNSRVYIRTTPTNVFARLLKDNSLDKVNFLFSRAINNIGTDHNSRLIIAKSFQKNVQYMKKIKDLRYQLLTSLKQQKITIQNYDSLIWKLERLYIGRQPTNKEQ